MSPTPLASTFRNFTTTDYKFHIYEVPTGTKFVLLTTVPKTEFSMLSYDLDTCQATLMQIYNFYWVPLVITNPFN